MTLLANQASLRRRSAVNDGRISLDLRIGVTEHRKLAPAPTLSAAIDRALDLILGQLRLAARDRCTLVAINSPNSTH